MWTEKTPAEIVDDLNALLNLEQSRPDTIIMSRHHCCWIVAMQSFGQRINRSNRHKFRRHYLAALQGA